MKNGLKYTLIVLGVFVGLAATVGVLPTVTIRNQAISLEENVSEAKSNISKEQNRRVSLFKNLVDSVESYNDYEQSTQSKIVEARSMADKGDVKEAKVALNAVVEKYPDLKSQDNYKELMTNLTSTENRLADYNESFNQSVGTYNRYTKRFPNTFYLGLTGYEVQTFEKTALEVDPAEGNDLFTKK